MEKPRFPNLNDPFDTKTLEFEPVVDEDTHTRIPKWQIGIAAKEFGRRKLLKGTAYGVLAAAFALAGGETFNFAGIRERTLTDLFRNSAKKKYEEVMGNRHKWEKNDEPTIERVQPSDEFPYEVVPQETAWYLNPENRTNAEDIIARGCFKAWQEAYIDIQGVEDDITDQALWEIANSTAEMILEMPHIVNNTKIALLDNRGLQDSIAYSPKEVFLSFIANVNNKLQEIGQPNPITIIEDTYQIQKDSQTGRIIGTYTDNRGIRRDNRSNIRQSEALLDAIEPVLAGVAARQPRRRRPNKPGRRRTRTSPHASRPPQRRAPATSSDTPDPKSRMQERNQIALKAAKEQIPLTRRRFVRYASLLAGAIAGGGLATIAERIAVSTPAGLYGRMFELIGADNEQVQKEIDDKAETLMSTIYERFQRYTAEKSGQASGGRIFSRDGELLQNIDEENYIHIEDVPPQLISAVTLLEDKRIRDYITESGVDPSAFSSAVAQTLIGDESRGGSGLLQQVIKNSLYSPEEIMHERDQTHKSAEIPLATMAAQYIRELMLEEFGDISEEALSREMTKFIQEMYFNSVPWGPNRGFTQAIKYFWDVDNPQDLNDLQCWVMATRPNRPSELTLHDPEEDYRKWADFAQDTVREIIREDINNRKVSPLIDDVIKDAVAVDLRHIPLGKANLDSSSTITNHNDGSDAATPYLNYLKFTLGSDNLGQVVRRNLDIVGTLDWELQQDLHRLVAEHQETLPDSAEIDVVVTNAEGEILAIAGDPIQEQPIGSVIKPMIFSDALDRGLITQNDEFPDTPLYIETTPEGNWTVKNHNNTNYGDKFGIGPSIATSLNTTTAQVGIRLGPSGIKDAYRRFGLYPDDQAYGLPDCLGVSTSNPLLIAQAYRCLANSGRINRSCPVKKIHGPDGSQIYAASPMTQPAVSATAADFIVKELYTDSNFMGGGWEVLQGGTENGVYFFSKTGTPDSQKAVYTAGGTLPYASDTLIDATPLTVVVRVRFPDPDDRLAENPTGVSHAAPLYRRIIEAFCNYKTPEAFSPTPRTPDSTIVAGINRDYDITEQVTNPEETYYSRTNNYALEKTKSPLQEHMAKNNPYKMVTLHWTATDSAEKSLQHLSNPNAERLGKAHYVIDKAGKIFRIINPREFCPVHVDETDPDLNLHSISIEIVGTFIDEDGDNIPSSDDDNTINQKQISSASELIKGLIANGVLSSEAEILGHLHAKESTNQDPSQEIVNSVGEKVKSYYEKITIAQRQRQ